MVKRNFYILITLIIGLSISLMGCKDNSYISMKDGEFIVSESLNYDQFLSELLKIDGITTNFQNYLHKLAKDDNSMFKIVHSQIHVSKSFNPNISFYCLIDNKSEKPIRILYTHVNSKDDKNSKLFHGQIFQHLDLDGNIQYIINGDFYNDGNRRFFKRDENVETKINVFNKGLANRDLEDLVEIPIHKPGLIFHSSLNNIYNDFSLSRGEESRINFHILANPKHYEKIYHKNYLKFD